jgi:hypothetical protein
MEEEEKKMIDTVRRPNASTGKVVVDAVAAPSKISPLRTSGVGVGDPSHHPEKKNNAQQ